jgi:hypothetical protein
MMHRESRVSYPARDGISRGQDGRSNDGENVGDFPGFEARVGPFLRGELGMEDAEEFKRLLCSDCEFFSPGEDEELECGCYHIMVRLLSGGHITLEQLANALGE